jgi:hypothetical protein
MPIRGSPNGAGYLRPQAGRDRPESVVAINRNGWSQSIGMAGRNRPMRAAQRVCPFPFLAPRFALRCAIRASDSVREEVA